MAALSYNAKLEAPAWVDRRVRKRYCAVSIWGPVKLAKMPDISVVLGDCSVG